ncbi:MAG: AbrB/MazE/SpoVT family DNA-binding domain-containing protein [Candidatus Geothermarchaeales archaeon]
MSIAVGKEGRIVLPKAIRKKYRMEEGGRVIVRECGCQIVLIPVATYDKPTEALHGSVKVERPIDQPKEYARDYMRRKLGGEIA